MTTELKSDDHVFKESVSISPEGRLIMAILASFDKESIRYVYLRNYENFPQNIGHDVDILVDKGMRPSALKALLRAASDCGWSLLRIGEYSPIAVFLTKTSDALCVHVDLFDRIEMHWIEFANSSLIMNRRMHNGTIWHPAPGDETFLNVCTRLVYHGIVREKHRIQAKEVAGKIGFDVVKNSFIDHLGSVSGLRLANAVLHESWDEVENWRNRIRRCILLKWGLLTPWNAISGFSRYLIRSSGRMLRPPGVFMVFEGADGVGKSTLISCILPFVSDLTGLPRIVQFHWKPTQHSVVQSDSKTAPQDPRGQSCRSFSLSIVYLFYHWLGFWTGWIRFIYWPLVRGEAVVGDRYSYDLYFDPARFRLNLPLWLLRLAAKLTPVPTVIIGLVANPELVMSRKPELTLEEITEYQSRLGDFLSTWSHGFVIEAGQSRENVIATLKTGILETLVNQATERYGHI